MTRGYEHETALLRKHGSVFRMTDALGLGVNRRALYAMRDAGVIEALSRGVYRIASLGPLADPDLVTLATRVPHGVVCLLSALALHDLTTQIPHTIDIALEQGARKPRIDHPPVQFHWFSSNLLQGVEMHRRDGVDIRVFDPEKTVVDCFRYRSQLGMDVVVEALRRWRDTRRRKRDVLLRYARVRRVERTMAPYLEML